MSVTAQGEASERTRKRRKVSCNKQLDEGIKELNRCRESSSEAVVGDDPVVGENVM